MQIPKKYMCTRIHLHTIIFHYKKTATIVQPPIWKKSNLFCLTRYKENNVLEKWDTTNRTGGSLSFFNDYLLIVMKFYYCHKEKNNIDVSKSSRLFLLLICMHGAPLIPNVCIYSYLCLCNKIWLLCLKWSTVQLDLESCYYSFYLVASTTNHIFMKFTLYLWAISRGNESIYEEDDKVKKEDAKS